MNSESMKTIQETKQHMLDSATNKNEYMTEGRRVLREERAARIARLNEEREQQEAEIRERANGRLISDDFEEKMAARQKAREERERKAREEEEERRKRREARLKLLMGEAEPPAATAPSVTTEGASTSTDVVTTELVPGLDGVLIHPKVLCSQYARLVKNLQKEIASLKDSITGSNEINKQLNDELANIKEERKELYERLEPYEKAQDDPLFKTPAPKLSEIPELTSYRLLPTLAKGEKVLAKFNDTDYITVEISDVSDDKVVVTEEDGSTEELKQDNVFLPIEDLAEQLLNARETEIALRIRIKEMEDNYQTHLKALEEEMAEAKADYEKMKEIYSVDVRKMFYSKDAPNATIQTHETECNVACHVVDVLGDVTEMQRGEQVWLTPADGTVKLWGPLSESNEEVIEPPVARRNIHARLFQLYQTETNRDEIAEIQNFKQDDLSEDHCYILDTNDEIYVYSGSRASLEDKYKATHMAMGAVKYDEEHGKQTPIIDVNNDNPPLRFRLRFGDWKEVKREELSAEAQTEAVNVDGTKEVYTYKQLSERDGLPKTIDLAHLESYLTPDEFETIFGMRRSKFITLPGWKKIFLKRKLKLF